MDLPHFLYLCISRGTFITGWLHISAIVNSAEINMAALRRWLCFEGNWREVIPKLRSASEPNHEQKQSGTSTETVWKGSLEKKRRIQVASDYSSLYDCPE